MTYPDAAGWKRAGTSAEAAQSVDAATVRARVFAWLTIHGPATTDETASALGLSVLTVRPRFSELRALGRLTDTGERHVNISGKRAVCWRVRAPIPLTPWLF